MPESENESIVDSAALAPDQTFRTDEVAELVSIAAPTEEAALVKGSLWNAIWVMSWPLMLTTIGGSIVGMVDVQVAGTLGSAVQAAVGLAEQVLFLFMVFIMSIGVGTTAIVSRAWGEHDRDKADHATAQSLSLSVIVGIALTIVAMLTAHYLVPLFSKSPDVVSQGDVYLAVYGLYLVPFSMICISNAAFRAIGDARITVLIIFTELLISIVGDYATVIYNWPVPGLGIRGIAYSAVVGALLAALMAVVCMSRSKLNNSLQNLLPISLETIKTILHIGVPSAFQRISWAASVFVVFFILARVPNPTAALASWTIGMRVEAFLFMPLMAFSLAVGSIVGQSLGAKRVDRAYRAGWHVTGIGVALMLVLATGLYLFAVPLAKVMSHDPKTIEYTASYLRINALAEPFLAVNMILSGALQGAGDTRITMWISVFSNWAVRLPLAWWLAIPLGWGPAGAWVAMSSSCVVSALAIAVRFQTGGWVKAHV